MPKSLLLLMLIRPRSRPRPHFTYIHKEFEKSKSAWYGFAWSKCDFLTLFWPTCRIFSEPEPWAYKQWTYFSLFELFENLQLPALLLSLAPRVALFSERAPWAHKQSTRFAVFVISENSSSLLCFINKKRGKNAEPSAGAEARTHSKK